MNLSPPELMHIVIAAGLFSSESCSDRLDSKWHDSCQMVGCARSHTHRRRHEPGPGAWGLLSVTLYENPKPVLSFQVSALVAERPGVGVGGGNGGASHF